MMGFVISSVKSCMVEAAAAEEEDVFSLLSSAT